MRCHEIPFGVFERSPCGTLLLLPRQGRGAPGVGSVEKRARGHIYAGFPDAIAELMSPWPHRAHSLVCRTGFVAPDAGIGICEPVSSR